MAPLANGSIETGGIGVRLVSAFHPNLPRHLSTQSRHFEQGISEPSSSGARE